MVLPKATERTVDASIARRELDEEETGRRVGRVMSGGFRWASVVEKLHSVIETTTTMLQAHRRIARSRLRAAQSTGSPWRGRPS